MQKLFRIGSVLMFVPILLWAAAWNYALDEENQSWYIMWPMFGFIGLAGLWHIALLIAEKERIAYFIYAVIHMPIFYGIWVVALILATRFPL
jgi:hypothetical protein